jgi:hypothetical protein
MIVQRNEDDWHAVDVGPGQTFQNGQQAGWLATCTYFSIMRRNALSKQIR